MFVISNIGCRRPNTHTQTPKMSLCKFACSSQAADDSFRANSRNMNKEWPVLEWIYTVGERIKRTESNEMKCEWLRARIHIPGHVGDNTPRSSCHVYIVTEALNATATAAASPISFFLSLSLLFALWLRCCRSFFSFFFFFNFFLYVFVLFSWNVHLWTECRPQCRWH